MRTQTNPLWRSMLAALGVLMIWAVGVRAADPAPLLLWPERDAGKQPTDDGAVPSITPWLPDARGATGTGVVICPGGGYEFLSVDAEGRQVAQWLNRFGVAGFVLRYRHHGVGFEHPAPMQDVQRAMQMVRSRAKEWHLAPDRIGVLGFSAGGHLASTAGTHVLAARPDAANPIERVTSRPDFMVLIYPVISMAEPLTHAGSRKNLLGADPDPKLVELMSNERQVTAQTPPTFLIHTTEDNAVPVENSVEFYLALRRAKVPAEMHIFQIGWHGFAMGKPGLTASFWPDLCERWMSRRGLMRKSQLPPPDDGGL